MEINRAATKYNSAFKRIRTFDLRSNSNYSRDAFLPLPWKIWPYEGKLLIILIGIWSILGLFILGSASWWIASKNMGDWSFYLKKQVVWSIAGFSIFCLILKTSIRNLLRISKIIFYFLIGLLILTILMGSTINGSQRWLILGPVQMQPSELIKPFAILEAANLFAHWNLVKNKKKIISITTFGLLILLIMEQPNLSTAGLTGILFWMMGLCGGINLKTLGSVASLGFLCGSVSIFTNAYQKLRVTSFLNPWKDQQDSGFQLVQSLLAIGSGGLFGQGFGLSTQKLQYLPFMYTDFIFAIFAEEFGLFGSILFLGFLVLFAYISLRIAIKCRNNYTKLVALGCAILLIGQSIMHIAVATGSMPTTGLPLPFISYGGNSLISSFCIVGMLLRCSLESTGFIGIFRARKSLN